MFLKLHNPEKETKKVFFLHVCEKFELYSKLRTVAHCINYVIQKNPLCVNSRVVFFFQSKKYFWKQNKSISYFVGSSSSFSFFFVVKQKMLSIVIQYLLLFGVELLQIPAAILINPQTNICHFQFHARFHFLCEISINANKTMKSKEKIFCKYGNAQVVAAEAHKKRVIEM